MILLFLYYRYNGNALQIPKYLQDVVTKSSLRKQYNVLVDLNRMLFC